MNPWPVEAEVPEVHLPRPGHADLVGTQKYKLQRRAQRARARERARDGGARGRRRAAPRRSCAALGVEVARHVVQIGTVHAPARASLRRGGLRRRRRRPGALPGRRREPRDGRAHQRPAQGQRVDRRRVRGDRVRADARAGLARQLGGAPRRRASPARSARSRPSRASSLGDAFERRRAAGLARRTTRSSGPHERGYYRETNRAGGLEGGMTTGAAARRPRRDEAAADADPAAALGRHRDARAGAGAARAHRLVHGARRPAWSARRWSRSCSPTPTGASSAATTSTTSSRRVRAYEERIGFVR